MLKIEKLKHPEPNQQTGPERRQLIAALREMQVGDAVAVRHSRCGRPIKTVGALVAKIGRYDIPGTLYRCMALPDGRVQVERTA